MAAAAGSNRARMRFFAPDPELGPYVTAIYQNDIDVMPGSRMVDMLHPEWANLRFVEGDPGRAAIGNGSMQPTPACVLAGPTCYATRFEIGTVRSWGIGFLPLGWAKFINVPAEQFADRAVDAEQEPATQALAALRPLLRDPDADPQAQARAINQHLRSLLNNAPPDDPLAVRAHAALADPEIGSVTALAARIDVPQRSLERVSRRVFGFPPKLLLRRQRFLRTLGAVMLNPATKWSDALDLHYYDQSHFNRDFQRFMGLTPGTYLAQAHPILDAAVRGRMAAAGAPMQVLHRPPG